MIADQDHERPQNPDPQTPLVLRSAEILRGRKEVWIEHEGQMYRLRETRSGKLILQK
jgi:hemin uptake protein HemP